MNKWLTSLAIMRLLVCGVALGVWANGRTQELIWLGALGGDLSIAHGVSDNGRFVVGVFLNNVGSRVAFRTNEHRALESVGNLGGDGAGAFAVSADGNIVVGWSFNQAGYVRAFQWINGEGIQALSVPLNYSWTVAYDVSADGKTVVGNAHNSFNRGIAVLWYQGRDYNLGGLPGFSDNVVARGVSADGNVVVGIAHNDDLGFSRAFRWTMDAGMQNLGVMPGFTSSFAIDVSADGKVVVGSVVDFHGNTLAFRWTPATGMESIGQGIARGVSADGEVVVGSVGDSLSSAAFRWTRYRGYEHLSITYAHLLSPGSALVSAEAVSPSGRFIVGQGFNAATRRREAFLLDTCPGGDTDNDCICDDWERYGLDVNNDGIIDLDLPALGARVGKRDIFVEYDSMVGQKPTAEALLAVRLAFQSRHINLHFVDGSHHNIPAVHWFNPWEEFDDFKTRYFGTEAERRSPNWTNIREAKRKIFRYGVFAQSYTGHQSNSSTGLAELPGNDFIVTLGHRKWQESKSKLPALWDNRRVTWDDFVASTLMHELGHTLGLRHGGIDHIQYKPNYYSVMNYIWQLPEQGYAAGWRLDYSGTAFNDLDENFLIEGHGIIASGGYEHLRVLVRGPFIRVGRQLVPADRLMNMSGPVDWNWDGDSNDIGVRLDINADNEYTVLKSHNDWYFLECTCDNANWADGVHLVLAGVDADLDEMTFSDWLTLARAGELRGDADLNGCVDDADLLAVLFAFGSTGTEIWEDLDLNGVVDDADLLIVLFSFGEGC